MRRLCVRRVITSVAQYLDSCGSYLFMAAARGRAAPTTCCRHFRQHTAGPATTCPGFTISTFGSHYNRNIVVWESEAVGAGWVTGQA